MSRDDLMTLFSLVPHISMQICHAGSGQNITIHHSQDSKKYTLPGTISCTDHEDDFIVALCLLWGTISAIVKIDYNVCSTYMQDGVCMLL